jgi:hypothetical protein
VLAVAVAIGLAVVDAGRPEVHFQHVLL